MLSEQVSEEGILTLHQAEEWVKENTNDMGKGQHLEEQTLSGKLGIL